MAEEISFQVFILIPRIWQQTHSVSFRETPVPMDSWSVPHLLLLVSFLRFSVLVRQGSVFILLHVRTYSAHLLLYRINSRLNLPTSVCVKVWTLIGIVLNLQVHCVRNAHLYLLMPVRDARSSVIFLNSLLKPLINSDNSSVGVFSVLSIYWRPHRSGETSSGISILTNTFPLS